MGFVGPGVGLVILAICWKCSGVMMIAVNNTHHTPNRAQHATGCWSKVAAASTLW